MTENVKCIVEQKEPNLYETHIVFSLHWFSNLLAVQAYNLSSEFPTHPNCIISNKERHFPKPLRHIPKH